MILRVPGARPRWPSVVEFIIETQDQWLISDPTNPEGILKSLYTWHSYGPKRKNLLESMRKYGLIELAGTSIY